MKIAVLGGYGVFGSLICEMLARDGHELAIVGRNRARAARLAAKFGARGIEADVTGDLSAVFADRPALVIDAAGPFQAYADDPWRVPRACIAQGANYLDLSDDAAFTAGIGQLDDQARQRGVWVLSGASSVPGLSSVVVAALAGNRPDIRVIDTAILPGNRAPRGASVVASIVGGVGKQTTVWRGGVWRSIHGWTDRRRYTLAPGVKRSAYFVDVPDIRLFPLRFKARSVMFRAGLELGVFNAALRALERLRRVWPLPFSDRGLSFVRRLSGWMDRFGTDRGGMQVSLVCEAAGRPTKTTWTLLAEAGHGPYVPGLVARALVRRADRVPLGARPCLAEITLPEFEAAASDLSITTATTETDWPTLFWRTLGDGWHRLPPEVRDLHGVQDVESFSGHATVTRGTTRLARLIARVFGFPPAGEDVPVTVTKTRTDGGEIWQRDFGGQVFRSVCLPARKSACFRERFGLFTGEIELVVDDGGLSYPVRHGWFLGLPLPRFLLPTSATREYVEDGQFHFDVALSAPLGVGSIVRYRGHLTPDRADSETV